MRRVASATRRLPRLLGGRPCLDFVNTVDPRNAQPSVDYLDTFADLLAWGRHTGLLGRAGVAAMTARARNNRRTVRKALGDAHALRAALSRLLSAASLCRRIRRSDLDLLNHWLLARRATLANSGLPWRFVTARDPSALLPSIAHDAAELLASGLASRVKECPGGGPCAWLFLDSTKNGSRRYCSSEGCGNRARVARFLSRRRAGRRQRRRG